MSKTVTQKIEKLVSEGTDEEVLFNFSKFLGRVGINTSFVNLDETDLTKVTHQVMYIHSGDKAVQSMPQPLEYPLQPVPVPDGEITN